MKRKIIAFLLALITLFALAACGGSGESDTKVTNDYAEGITVNMLSESQTEVYLGSKEGKTRLKISFVEAGYGAEWLRVIATHFVKANPEYWLYLYGDPGLTEIVSTQLSSGLNLSDIYMPLSSSWQNYALTDWLEELSGVYDSKPDGDDGKTVFEKLEPAWQEYCVASNRGVDGKYAFPWTQAVTGIAYNETMFKEYGWEIPETFEELLALCGKITADTNGKIAPFVYPGNIGGYFDYIGMAWWMQSSGIEGIKEFFRYESAEVYNPAVQPGKGKLEALEAFTQLFGPGTSNALKSSMSKNHTEAQISFLRKEAAMIINASWLEREMINDLPEGMQIRMMRFPYISTALKDENGEYKKVNYATTPDYMIVPRQAENKEGAKKFLSFLAKDEILFYFAKHSGAMMPFRTDFENIYGNMTQFGKDCLDIWKESESFFDMSKSVLNTKGFVSKWLTGSPYAKLIYGLDNDGTTPSRYCRGQYQEARGSWAEWVKKAGEQ